MVPSPGPRSPVKTLNGFNKMYEAASLKNNRNSLDVSSLKTVRKVKEEPEEEAFNWRENLIKMREQIKAVRELPSISAPDPAKYDESSGSYVQSLHVLIIISDITARTQAQPPRQT